MAFQILVVDAEPTAAQVTGAIAQRIAPSAIVRYEATPQHGWSALQQDEPDLIIIDPTPFGAAGALLIRLCRELYPAARVVALVSALTAPLRRTLHDLGVAACLEKPTAPAALVASLRAVMQPAHINERCVAGV
jgi:DNA-binding NarL/FixJ family response regulator